MGIYYFLFITLSLCCVSDTLIRNNIHRLSIYAVYLFPIIEKGITVSYVNRLRYHYYRVNNINSLVNSFKSTAIDRDIRTINAIEALSAATTDSEYICSFNCNTSITKSLYLKTANDRQFCDIWRLYAIQRSAI